MKITIMLFVPDCARADVMIKEDRIYYRFDTENTRDEGDLPGLKDGLAPVAERLLEGLLPLPGEEKIRPEEMRVSIFVDNVVRPDLGTSEKSIARMVDQLLGIDESFAFLQGFV